MKLKASLIKSIDFYQKNISFFIKRSCVFYPTCSEYAKNSVSKYGIVKGLKLALFRFFRCHPWQKNQIDIVP